ncbi:reverse transcriptase domain-containing protein [Acetomicrobium hydrogeniformans]|uniref:reverse transcriptase domain-containing protein n=1 Tax=Acetomicrobium hydrogeniformans TaxID=649746 RepID=UPI002357A3AD|nr:reverse transcriptase domain-containing protein [Acetomicrobium hydrogeniformans]
MATIYYSLYDRMLLKGNLYQGYLGVKKAKGSAGIDRQTIADFEENLEANLTALAQELRDKRKEPQPVKRQEIPKPGGGIRKLGIPAVRDRVVQQTLLNILQPIYDPDFHPSSYGYRPGRSCHQAIAKATLFMRKYGLRWVVDMDLSKCFDTLDHELIIQALLTKESSTEASSNSYGNFWKAA